MKRTLIALALVSILSCGPSINSQDKSNSPTPEATPFNHIVPSDWDLHSRIEDGKIYFDWQKRPDVFLYVKENCSWEACGWKMLHEWRAETEADSYTWWDWENEKFFGPKYYTLGPSFSYTVNWADPGLAGLTHYEVFFYAKGLFTYSRDVPLGTTSFKFDHLDPNRLPWIFTIYARTYNEFDPELKSRQIEIGKIELTSVPAAAN